MAVAAGALVFLGLELFQPAEGRSPDLAAGGAAGVAMAGLWIAFAVLNRHFRDLDRLREAWESARPRGDSDWSARRDELGRLAQAAAEVLKRERRGGSAAGERLSRTLHLVEEPAVILDDLGRIDLLNSAAGHLLGAEPGGDIYDVISRPDLFRAIERARESDGPVAAAVRRRDGQELPVRLADLGLQAGVALLFPVRGADLHPLLPGDRSVVLRPLSRGPSLDEDAPLAAIPFVALWVATTGAGPEDGRVAAVGTVRLAGARVFRTVSLNVLVDPGEPVTPEATARHGVSPDMVAGARPFAAVWPAIAEALHHCVVVGVEVDAALAALARDCAAAGVAAEMPPALDLGRLAAVLDPALTGAPLEVVAAAFGLRPDARVGLFAPALLQAELAAALLPRLERQGITTHGQARGLSTGASLAADEGEAPGPGADRPGYLMPFNWSRVSQKTSPKLLAVSSHRKSISG
ncbi:exonuclease domain-containing protein [Azospirillum thermophilum]|nr:exonuclease domain-containing protein [Azospirillum thermophilum]